MIKKWARPVIILITLLSLLQAYWVVNLQFNYNFEALFPTDDPQLQFFNEFRTFFADNNEYLSVGIYNKGGLFEEQFLKKLAKCTADLEATNRVIQVTSPATMKFLSFNLWGKKKKQDLLHIHQPNRYAKDSTYIYRQTDLLHNFFSETGQSLCIYLQIEKGLSLTPQGDSLLQDLYHTLDHHKFDSYHLLGALQSQHANTKKVQTEFYLFTTVSSLIVVSFLFLLFRALWGIIVPLVVIGLCGLWAMGVMGAVGVEVNLMTMMIPTIIFVVAMSDVIHLLSKYMDELRLGKSQEAALLITIKEVGLATFLTSVTTALGFLTLLTAGVKPFVQFGVFAAIGVLLAFFITFSLLPAILILLPKPNLEKMNVFSWNGLLSTAFKGVIKQHKAIIFGTLLILVFALIGLQKLSIHAYFTQEIDQHDPLSQDIQFFEKQFGGIRPFEISVSLKDSTDSLWNPSIIRELNQLEEYLQTDYQVHKLYSFLGVLKAANRSLRGGDGHFYRLPKSEKALQKLINQLRQYSNPQSLKAVISEDGQRARISGSIYDIGSTEVAKRNEALQAFVEQQLNTAVLEVKLTGSATMIDRSHTIMSINMLQGLGFALVVVSIVMGILYRNPKAILIALIPNMLPLLIIGGILGWSGVGLNMSTSIIFTIAFGIAVDDTIHFMTKLNIELRKGFSLLKAVQTTFISTGKAIILTSFMLSSGFFVMMLSDFNGTFYMGLLVGLTLIIAVIADLLLIPLLALSTKLSSKKNEK